MQRQLQFDQQPAVFAVHGADGAAAQAHGAPGDGKAGAAGETIAGVAMGGAHNHGDCGFRANLAKDFEAANAGKMKWQLD